ncbi:MAG: hypothetical protein WCX28_14165 [Bacteriovoracaceae bacterium]
MSAEEREIVLIEYAEGTLPKEQTAKLEALLDRSPEAREELEIIRSAFQRLNGAPSDSVPDHYFSNFLPQLRQKIDHGQVNIRWSIPRFFEPLIRPAMIAVGVVIFVSAYRSLEPQTTSSPIYNLISEFAPEEIVVVLNEPSIFAYSGDESTVEVALNSEVFGLDPSQFQSESDLSTALEDQDFEQVVQQLEMRVSP